MKISTSFKSFKKKHLNKINQVIYFAEKFKSKFIIDNLIDNFLIHKNSFVFESVEKGKIRGRFTIFGKNPDKIWELNNNQVFKIINNKKKKIKENLLIAVIATYLAFCMENYIDVPFLQMLII